MMKNWIFSLLLSVTALTLSAANYEVASPNGKVRVTVTTDDALRWSVSYDGKTVLQPSAIDLQVRQGKKLFGLGKIGKVAWDWWNNTNLTGVDFAAGMNTDTYLY